MIGIKRSWYSIQEAAKKIGISIDDLFHLGILGKIDFGYNWYVLDNNMREKNLCSGYKFSTLDDNGPLGYLETDRPDYCSDPLKAIAFLSRTDITLLQHNKSVRVANARIGDFKLSVSIQEYTDIKSPIIITIDNIIITSQSIKDYLDKEIISSKNKAPQGAPCTHTSELLQVQQAVINEFWEGKPDNKQTSLDANNYRVERWVLNNYPQVSSSIAKYIARIVRPDKYK